MKGCDFLSVRKKKSGIAVPLILIVCFAAAAFLFYTFFVKAPRDKAEDIKAMINEGKTAEAAELLYDFSYMEFSDRAELKRICQIDPSLILYSLETGDIFYFGQYEQNNADDGKEPIEWRVLSVEDGEILLQTTKVIEGKAYHSDVIERYAKPLKWKDTTLCVFLNGEFLNSAFSETEKEMMIGTPDGKITILNEDEYDEYKYQEYSPGEAEPTEYVRNNNALRIAGDGLTGIWLRKEEGTEVQCIYSHYSEGGHWKKERSDVMQANGVRPVIKLKVGMIPASGKEGGAAE